MEPGLVHRVLTVINYNLDDDEEKIYGKTRVTIQPSLCSFMLASHAAIIVESQELYKVNLVFSANQVELYVSPLDLSYLEMAIGIHYISVN